MAPAALARKVVFRNRRRLQASGKSGSISFPGLSAAALHKPAIMQRDFRPAQSR
jgi:hypothetical protein